MYKRGVSFAAPIFYYTAEQVYILPSMVEKDSSRMVIGMWLVCLSPDVLERTKDEAIYTIALELSHVYLKHSQHKGTAKKAKVFRKERLMLMKRQ